MEEIYNALEIFEGAWPTIQPAISTVFGALVARLFLRGDTSKSEIEKIKQVKFSAIADKLLEGGHITHLEYYKCRNFNRIAQRADEVYQRKQASTVANTGNVEEKFSIDWFVRFFEEAGNISDEDIQKLWAKVLAGELEKPGSFSLRTLDVLRSLSKSEAEIFQKLASYSINDGNKCYISVNKELKNQYGYSRDLYEMYDCNLIENNVATLHPLRFEGAEIFMTIGSLVCYTNNETAEKIYMELQRFTKIGNELIRLVSPDEIYALDFFKKMKVVFPQLKLTAHAIIEKDGSEIKHSSEDLLI